MNRAALAVVMALAGCGPAPYAIEPDDAPPPPTRYEQVPVIVVQQAPAVVVAAPPPAAPALPDGVAATLRRHHHKFHKCYAKALRRDRSLRGSTLVRVVLESDGDVDSATDIGGDLPDRKLRECIVDVYEDMEFPPSVGGRVFDHPLQFTPGRRGGIVR